VCKYIVQCVAYICVVNIGACVAWCGMFLCVVYICLVKCSVVFVCVCVCVCVYVCVVINRPSFC